MLVNWFYGGIRTLLLLWWTITVEPVLEGNLYKKNHLEILWISSLYPQSAYMYLCGLHCLKSDILFQRHLWWKKKRCQESASYWTKSLWGQEEDIPSRLCRNPSISTSSLLLRKLLMMCHFQSPLHFHTFQFRLYQIYNWMKLMKVKCIGILCDLNIHKAEVIDNISTKFIKASSSGMAVLLTTQKY